MTVCRLETRHENLEKVSGAGTATFGNAAALKPRVIPWRAIHVRLAASDSALLTTDDVVIVAFCTAGESGAVVNAVLIKRSHCRRHEPVGNSVG